MKLELLAESGVSRGLLPDQGAELVQGQPEGVEVALRPLVNGVGVFLRRLVIAARGLDAAPDAAEQVAGAQQARDLVADPAQRGIAAVMPVRLDDRAEPVDVIRADTAFMMVWGAAMEPA